MELPVITDIQRYSIHDGDGIRTTIFFKGCPLRCGWCHNPESQRSAPEIMVNAEKCTGCGDCVPVCRRGAVRVGPLGLSVTDRESCRGCGDCVSACLNGARELAGRVYPVDALVREALKDRMFYEQSGGGVTLSGGEVMAQPFDYVRALARTLSEEGVRVNIDTCGEAPYERFARLLPYVDTFLYDVKEMDGARHRRFTGAGNERILGNLRRLSDAGARIYLRLPLIGGVNASDTHIRAVIAFLRSGVHAAQINLLPYHDIGKSKYARLDRAYDADGLFAVPSAQQMAHFVALFHRGGYSHVIIGG